MNDARWHYTQNGAQQTPISDTELRQRAADGRLKPMDMVWCEGMPQWGPAGNITGLFPAAAVLPPPMPAPGAAPINYYGNPAGYRPPASGIGQDAGMRMLLPVGRSPWAIVAGYLGLLSVIILPAPLAVIFSIIAIMDIKKHPEKHGMGRAIFGLIMGIVFSIGLLIWIGTAAMH
ncbi:MAG TPA: GYF domain-containing protein [Tepidisphaeraceae bacterium]|jgi:hypothetical protein|nr:GYF domain-containing protein [Tepidisphaeraceae bacterium]